MPKLPHPHVDPKPLFKYHSLTVVSVAILSLWFVLYLRSNPDTHWGSFFGNAIADWLGAVVIITGIGWVIAFARMDTNSRWGQVVGNIVSEWTQALGTVFLTKKLVERGREDRKQ